LTWELNGTYWEHVNDNTLETLNSKRKGRRVDESNFLRGCCINIFGAEKLASVTKRVHKKGDNSTLFFL
jgi:hypothetical protein